MRAADAEVGATLIVRDEHRGRITGSAIAKVEVVSNMSRGFLKVRVVDHFFGWPMCMSYTPHVEEEGDVRKVLSRFCWPWHERHDEQIAETKARGAEAKRRRTVVENLQAMVGLGTIAANGRWFFEYDDAVELGHRLGLEFTTGGEDVAA